MLAVSPFPDTRRFDKVMFDSHLIDLRTRCFPFKFAWTFEFAFWCLKAGNTVYRYILIFICRKLLAESANIVGRKLRLRSKGRCSTVGIITAFPFCGATRLFYGVEDGSWRVAVMACRQDATNSKLKQCHLELECGALFGSTAELKPEEFSIELFDIRKLISDVIPVDGSTALETVGMTLKVLTSLGCLTWEDCAKTGKHRSQRHWFKNNFQKGEKQNVTGIGALTDEEWRTYLSKMLLSLYFMDDGWIMDIFSVLIGCRVGRRWTWNVTLYVVTSCTIDVWSVEFRCNHDFYYFGFVYLGRSVVCGVILSLYPHRTSWK